MPLLGEPLPGDLGTPILRAEQRVQGYQQPGYDPAEAERLARLKEAEEAAASSVFFSTGGQRATAAAPTQAAAPAFAANAAFDPLAAGPASTAAQPLDPTAVQNRQEQKEAFLSSAGSTQTRNSGYLQMPVSPYQVMAGTVIPAALVTGIKIDLVEQWTTLPNRLGYKSQTTHSITPLEDDGSVKIPVPCETPLLMLGVDKDNNDIAVDNMAHSLRSGEKRTCHGCHDGHSEQRAKALGDAVERFKQTEAARR